MKSKTLFYLIITSIIVFSVFARFIPHFPNFAPMGALVLFAIAFYKRSAWAVGVSALVWWVSDFYLNNFVYHLSDGLVFFTQFQFFTLLSIVAIVVLGKLLFNNITIAKVLTGSITASLIFFIISNFGVWLEGTMYPMTFNGIITCYKMAIPFYKATFVSDMVFTTVFFGLMYLLQDKLSEENQFIFAK